MSELRLRTPAEVLDDHLRLAQQRDVGSDLARNYSPDCVVLTGRGVFRGHEGIRQLARALDDEVPRGAWGYRLRLVEGPMAYLEWTADSGDAVVEDGADSFLIVDGQVVCQTIHYTVRSPEGVVLIARDGSRPAGS